MEQAKMVLKKVLKTAVKALSAILFPVIVIFMIVVIFLAAATYFITVDDGTYKDDDWSSTPYAAGTYINGTKVESDGTISGGSTAQELWDKMLENGSRVDEYLDSPEELARLMKAEIVTQYPDTRSNPDEEINWDEVINDSDTLQGIIKFKRADTDGNTSTMTYTDPETFQGYIDEYKSSGSDTARQNALSHFTLKKTSSSASTSGGGLIAAGEGVMTDVSQAIINATNTTPWPGEALCSKWVNDVYENAGLTPKRVVSAYEQSLQTVISTDRTAIPIGAAVYGTGTGTAGGPYGHVGIYIGDGKVVDSVSSGIKVSTLDEWIGWQENYARNSNNVLTDINGNEQHGWLGWGWADGDPVRGTTEDPNLKENSSDSDKSKEEKEEEDKIKDENERKATVTNVSGDGYSQEYTSSAGITYKMYRQFEGSYANNSYWGSTIHRAGCGPSAVAILASGLTGYNYSPGDIATQMGGENGLTSYETLKTEMDSLGMESEVVHNPSAQTIQDNLRNGKVMLVSVNSNTMFTDNSHIMAIVDINTDGQVYICNPGSSSLFGWYDMSDIMSGCQYIVVTDAEAAGIAETSNETSYVAVVATWKQVDTTVETNDPNVEAYSESEYTMTTTDVNYEEMIEPYTMPFDMLWALLVVGEDKNFVFEIADLIYNSDIEITVHDNLTTNTDVDEWNYSKRTKAIVNANITATGGGRTLTEELSNHLHDPAGKDQEYQTTKTVVTYTNTVNVALTRANVWIVDYENSYKYVEAGEGTTSTDTINKDDQEYPNEPTREGTDYSFCEDIPQKRSELESSLKSQLQSSSSTGASSGASSSSSSGTATGAGGTPSVSSTVDVHVDYYDKYVNISDNVSNTVQTQRYTAGTPDLKEKTDPKSEEPNFVTIFNKGEYKSNKSAIKDASSWLFEIIEINESTADMLDLIKYLLFKATGIDYGVTEFDFSIFYPGELITVGAGDYIVHIDKSSQDIVIKDVETLKQAFSGYSGSSELINHAQEFLDLQEEYRVNAVFAAAVSISETSAGRAGHATNGKNNWFNIECTCGGNHGRFETYSSARESIEAFYRQIAVKSYYFTEGNYTVRSIGMIYCENADAPGGWIENTTTFMTQMFNAAGINPSSSATATEQGEAIVAAAREKLGCSYVWGAAGPDTFDCSGLTQWCYKQAGISISHNTESQKNEAKKQVPVSEARVGDILYKSGHVGIYIGNGEFIHAPHTGDVVKISKVAGYGFSTALQFY